MIELYGLPISAYCAKLRVVLRYKQIQFDEQAPPDGYGSDAYRRIIPMGTIPGFIDGEVVLSESEAIAEYLEETHPVPPVLPGDHAGRAYVRSLSRIHDCWVEPQVRALYAHASPGARNDAVVTQRVEDFWRRLGQFEDCASLAPFAAGAAFSLADCAWVATFFHAEMLLAHLGHAFELTPALAAWRERLHAHPAVTPEVAVCRDAMRAWLTTKT